MDMVLTADVTQIQMSNWSMSHAKRVAVNNKKNPEYHVVVEIKIGRLRTDKHCSADDTWPNHGG